jgi:hypothetical protein
LDVRVAKGIEGICRIVDDAMRACSKMYDCIVLLEHVTERRDRGKVALDEPNAIGRRAYSSAWPNDANDLAASRAKPCHDVAADESSGTRDHDSFTRPTVQAVVALFM